MRNNCSSLTSHLSPLISQFWLLTPYFALVPGVSTGNDLAYKVLQQERRGNRTAVL
jgi:hypothetical protein